MLIDQFGRIHDYLRISLTDHCNLRCFYCMPAEEYPFSTVSGRMSASEIETLAGIFVQLGVKKIRITGGEPLLRKDAGNIIQALAALPVELTMTSNGTMIDKFIDQIETAGIGSVNISLDSLQESSFHFITRSNEFKKVIDNIELLLSRNIRVKVNVVVIKGINDGEILDFIDWTIDKAIEVRFIEFMPFAGNRWTSNKVFSLSEILDRIAEKFSFTAMPGTKNDTAKHFQISGHAGSFAVISTMTSPFCSSCNRMRLTADGKLKNCLFSVTESDLLTALRKGYDPVPMIMESIFRKEKELGGQFSGAFTKLEAAGINNRSMISIGG